MAETITQQDIKIIDKPSYDEALKAVETLIKYGETTLKRKAY